MRNNDTPSIKSLSLSTSSAGLSPMTLLTVNQAADRLTVSTRTIERLVQNGVLRLHRVGPHGPRRFHLRDVDRALIPADSVNEQAEDLDAFITASMNGKSRSKAG